MSRRARKKRGGVKEPWVGKFVVCFGVFLLLALTLGYAGLRTYLHSEGFRKFLSTEVSKKAKVVGAFSAFRWDGLAVETKSFEAIGEGMIASISADQIGTEVGFGALGKGAWELKQTRVSRVELELDFTKKNERPLEEVKVLKKQKKSGWVPSKVELESVTVGELAIRAKTNDGDVAARGLKVKLEPLSAKGTYEGEITGGTIDPAKAWLPTIRLEKVRGSFRDGSAFITSADLKAWESGRIDAFGEWDSKTGTYAFEGDLDGVKCDEVLNENWARRLTGDVSSTFSVNNISGKMAMSGDLTVRNATLTALPMLDALAAYADTRRFRIMQLSDARTKWRYSEGVYTFTDFVMASEGLIRLEGNFSIKGKSIDGLFRLGLVPGTLAGIPGAETDVFLPGERGLLWTPVRITGTLDDPKEDLTDRLIDAAGMRMFDVIPETGAKAFKFTKSVIGETPDKVIDKGLKIIDEGEKVIEEAGDVIKGLLGD